MIAARSGYDSSLKEVKEGFVNGWVAKHEFEQTLRAHKESKDEMKSEARDRAMAKYPYHEGPRQG